MSVTPKDFAPFVSADVPNCPKFIIERAILSTIIEFCTKSWRFNDPEEDVDIYKDDPYITFSERGSNVVVGVFDVRYDGETLDRKSVRDMDSRYGKGWKKRTGAPEAYIDEDHGKIRLYPIPDKDYPEMLSARVAYAPKMTVLRVDNMFFDYYLDAIVAGAVARLVMQEGKTWFNPNIAIPFKQQFDAAVYSARNIVMRDVYQTSPLPKML